MITLMQLISSLFLTLVIGGFINMLIADFNITLRVEKRILMQLINCFVFMWVSNVYEQGNATANANL